MRLHKTNPCTHSVYDESIKLDGVLWLNAHNHAVYYVNLVNIAHLTSVFGFYNCI